MGNILLISENEQIINKYEKMFNDKSLNLYISKSVVSTFDLIDMVPFDIVLIDQKFEYNNLSLTIKRIKSKLENTQILLLTNTKYKPEEYSKYLSGYILEEFSPELIRSVTDAHLKNKKQADSLSERNKDLADSLYRLNVLYNTSSQFAGTLDTKKLFEYMI